MTDSLFYKLEKGNVISGIFIFSIKFTLQISKNTEFKIKKRKNTLDSEPSKFSTIIIPLTVKLDLYIV